ncbi:tRNA (guanine(10)-N2)-methyltransferase [Dirofilaria immitis]
MKKFIFIFSQVHVDFRYAEMESICDLYKIPCGSNISLLCSERHVYIFEFASLDDVTLILSRSVLIKFAIEWMASCNDYNELYANIEERRCDIKNYDSTEQSFAIRIRSIGKTNNRIPPQSIIADIGKALNFKNSPVDLNKPCNIFYVVEEYDSKSLQRLHFGKLIGYGQGQLKNDYSLADRCYIGNTTIDPELSFLQTNIAKVDVGSLVLDPFCGTGGLLIAAAHFGAAVLGSEINYQIARAVGRSSRAGIERNTAKESVIANFRQYGTDVYFMGLVIGDASQHQLWHPGTYSGTHPVFDAIITDPPYGVREKGQRVGIKGKKESWIVENVQNANHYPEKAKYSISSTFLDLIDLAGKLLVVGGRLLFWFPVFDDEYSEAILPRHDAMKLIYNCEQSLSRRYSRRLLVYEKLRMAKDDEKTYVEKNCYEDTTFRQRVFRKN